MLHPTPDAASGQAGICGKADIYAALEVIAAPKQCIGLWIKGAQPEPGITSPFRTGYFTDRKALVKAVQKHDGKCAGIYITANAVARKALSAKVKGWAWNRLSPYPGSPSNPVILDRRRLLIDIDPKRPKDVSATDAEKKLAVANADELVAFLTAQGWPRPIVIDSGNGIQLVYKIKLPVASPLPRQVLKALAAKFGDKAVTIDPAVSAAKQLMRLPGTMNCKGMSTKSRPHRRAKILSAPTKLKTVPEEKLVALTAKPPKASEVSKPDLSLAKAKKYVDAIPGADRTASDGSSKALVVARAIVVGFSIPWDSDDAWDLLKSWNSRCTPPWDVGNPAESHDLRRKLKETFDHAVKEGHEFGGLLTHQQRHYTPLEGPLFPIAVPDYDWMAADTAAIVLEDPAFPYAYGLRMLACWQRQRADVFVPDILVRDTQWGAKAPEHWRKHYRKAVKSRLAKHPPFLQSALCTDLCMLHGTKKPHHHYKIPLASNGLLDKFRKKWDFVCGGPNWEKHVKNGKVYRGYWPALIFGCARPVGLTPRQARFLAAVTRELTRLARRPTGKTNAEGELTYFKPPSDRPDRAEIIENARVANSAYTHDKLVCPYLDKDQRYVGFNGNYRRHHGRGYRLAWWMERAGYEKSNTGAKQLLTDLGVLAERFELTIAGRHHASQRWHTLAELQQMLSTGSGVKRLDRIMVRVFAPEDFLTLWRCRFAQWLGFSWIPGADCPFPLNAPHPGVIQSGDELKKWMTENNVSQAQLAEQMKVTRETISRNLRRPTSRTSFWEKVNKAIGAWPHEEKCDI